jgi:hypothetical protein
MGKWTDRHDLLYLHLFHAIHTKNMHKNVYDGPPIMNGDCCITYYVGYSEAMPHTYSHCKA